MANYSLTINLNPCEIPALRDRGFHLCVSQKINNQYTVVYKAIEKISKTNVIQFSSLYEIFAAETCKLGDTVVCTSMPASICGGQTVTLGGCGNFGCKTGSVDFDSPIGTVNECDQSHFGLNSYDPDTDAFLPVCISTEPVRYGFSTSFKPSRVVQVWFEDGAKAGSIITESQYAYEVDLTGGSKTVTFLGNNLWYEGPGLSFCMNGPSCVKIQPTSVIESAVIKHSVDFTVPVKPYYNCLVNKLSMEMKRYGYTDVSFDIDSSYSRLSVSLKKSITYQEVKQKCVSDTTDVANSIGLALKSVKSQGQYLSNGNWDISCPTDLAVSTICPPKAMSHCSSPVVSSTCSD